MFCGSKIDELNDFFFASFLAFFFHWLDNSNDDKKTHKEREIETERLLLLHHLSQNNRYLIKRVHWFNQPLCFIKFAISVATWWWTNESTKLPLMDIWNKMKFQQKKRLSKKKWQMMMMMWFTLTCTVFFFYSNFLKNFFLLHQIHTIVCIHWSTEYQISVKKFFFSFAFLLKKNFYHVQWIIDFYLSVCECVCVFLDFKIFFSIILHVCSNIVDLYSWNQMNE